MEKVMKGQKETCNANDLVEQVHRLAAIPVAEKGSVSREPWKPYCKLEMQVQVGLVCPVYLFGQLAAVELTALQGLFMFNIPSIIIRGQLANSVFERVRPGDRVNFIGRLSKEVAESDELDDGQSSNRAVVEEINWSRCHHLSETERADFLREQERIEKTFRKATSLNFPC
jgi:hypothetical protein